MPLKEDIKKPFNLLNLALAILGVGLALYFYFFPHNAKGIAYVGEGPSLIFDSKLSTPKIRLVDGQNTPITSDTYLQTFTLWNSGSAPIEPSDIRRPVRFIFDGAEQILDYKIVEATDQDVCGFSLTVPQETNISSKAVELSWKHLDPKKAAKIQVVFAQSSKPKVQVSKDILGVEKLTVGVKRSKSFGWALTIIMIGGAVSGVDSIREGFREGKNNFKRLRILLGVVQIVCLVVLIWITAAFSLLQPTPPL